LVLRYYEDLSEADTAQLMGCSVGTVKSQVSAALGKLRERIGPDSGVLLPEDQAVTR
jgi:DNA-directed RNA polymerase specialized sigma24 family protein